MATRFFTRSSLLAPTKQTLSSFFSRSFTSLSLSKPLLSVSATGSSSLLRLRPLVAVVSSLRRSEVVPAGLRGFASRQTSSSLSDPNPNWSNRPPKETILLDGCDFEHWLVVVEKPEGEPTRDEIIDSYIKTLAQVVGSEEEARMKIYSVSTRHYFAFGALVSEELSYKLKELPGVRWVLPDSYLDVRNKDYGGEPFINGQAVPYDPKYHEEWVRNNARANERNRRNDRPRNHDRSRNFERRNMGPGGPRNSPPSNMGGDAPNRGMPPPNNYVPYNNNMGGQQAPSYAGPQPPNPNYNMGQQPPNPNYNMGQQQPNPNYNMGQQQPNPNYMGQQQPNPNYMGQQPPNYGGQQPPNMGGNQHAQNFRGGEAPHQPGFGPNQNYAPNMAGGNSYQNQNMPGRDIPPTQNYQ